MDHSFVQQESETQKSVDLGSRHQVFKSILRWLVNLVELSEEEQKDAGILIGYRQD